MTRSTAASLGLALFASSALVFGVVILGARTPGYSQLRHTISELGAHGSPNASAAAFGLFLPIGVACLGVACLSGLRTPLAWLGGSLAIGYLGAALFPCDVGAPLQGSARNGLHLLAGGLEYAGALACMLFLAAQRGGRFWAAASLLLLCVAAMATTSALRGLAQRGAEGLLFCVLIALAVEAVDR